VIGKQGIDQANRFKAQLRSLQKKRDTVTLLTVVTLSQRLAHQLVRGAAKGWG